MATADLSQSHNMGINALGQITFPSEAYTIQQNWLQLHVCKPLEMTVCTFQFCIKEINTMLLQFPGNRGQAAVCLNKIELKELFWRSIPRKWQVCLTNKSAKRHLISKNNFNDKLDTIQLVELQQNPGRERGRRPHPSRQTGLRAHN